MTNKEILAELKRCYEYLYDIQENHTHEQVSREDEKEINHAMISLALVYKNVFKETIKQNEENIELPKKYQDKEEYSYIICDDIYGYVSIRHKATDEITECYLTAPDFDEYVWYEDYNFIAYDDYIGENL